MDLRLKGAGYEPRVVIDKFASYAKPRAELLPDIEHRRGQS